MNKLYSVHDHWTDIAKKNDVDIESIDGDITRILVNGEDYGGGGGESDFSTAEVTIVNNGEGSYIVMPVCLEADEYDSAGISYANIDDYATETFTVPLYKGASFAQVTDNVNYSVSGDIEDIGGGHLNITGNGTITIGGQ